MKILRPLFAVLAASLCSILLNAASANPDVIDSEFLEVLRGGEARKLRQALDGGASVRARDAAGNTPLILAAGYGDLACLRVLLDYGADVNATNSVGESALIRAAADYEKVRLLVNHGADVNARSGFGNTPLILTARPASSHRAVELLLRGGADAKATNQFGATALMAAAAGGDERTVRLLLRHGADVNAQPIPGETGFLFGGGRTALMWAAFRGNITIVKQLLEAGADVNAMGGLGTALAQAAWANQTAAARELIEHGARVNAAGPRDGYTPLHWAVSTEERDAGLIQLLLEHGADPNLGGGEVVDAFLGTPQTPLMLASRRGNRSVLGLLAAAGATNATPDRIPVKEPPARSIPKQLDRDSLERAVSAAIAPLQQTALFSKESFLRHSSQQDCTSCHSQHLPLAALGAGAKIGVAIDRSAERKLIEIVRRGEIPTTEPDWQPLFHPDPAQTKGYAFFGLALANVTGEAATDGWVHHLAAIQGKEGQWHNNLPRPPIQTGDIGATALAVHALKRFGLPGREAEFVKRVDHARRWLRSVTPENNEGRVYQLLGLAWAGEPLRKLLPLAKALLDQQDSEGGWAQLPGLAPDAYATGQAVYALRTAAGLQGSDPSIDRAVRFLLRTQLEDGTWYVRRRAFPFQPTMNSGFPHGRDSWISTAATSWAVLALSVQDANEETEVAASRD